MATHAAITANGDYQLTRPVEPTGRLSLAWDALTGPFAGITIVFKARHVDSEDGTTVDVPIANGKVVAATVDGQSIQLQSLNIECRCDAIIASITGYTSGTFDIWCS